MNQTVSFKNETFNFFYLTKYTQIILNRELYAYVTSNKKPALHMKLGQADSHNLA